MRATSHAQHRRAAAGTCAALLLLFTPLADAADLRPVPTIIFDELGYSDYGGGTWVLRFNVSFEMSPDDSRAGGADTGVRYDLCGLAQALDVSTVTAGGLKGYTCNTNLTVTPITGRAGWAWASGITTDACAGNGTTNPTYCSTVPPLVRWNISAYDAGGSKAISCSVVEDHRAINRFTNSPSVTTGLDAVPPLLFPWGGDGTAGNPSTYNACGSNATLAPAAGILERATTPYGPNATDGATTEVSWAPSPDDNATAPYLDYYWFHSATIPHVDRLTTYCGSNTAIVNCFQCTGIFACALCISTSTCQMLTCEPGAVACGHLVYRGLAVASGVPNVHRLNATWRSYKTTPTDGVRNVLYSTIVVRDNLTHQQSTFSCYANLQEGVVGSADACGGASALTAAPLGGAPVFPFIDVPQQAARLGLGVNVYGLLLGILLVGGLAALGSVLAGRFGGVVLGALGLGTAYSFNTVMGWVIVLVFAVCVLLVVLRLRQPTAGDAS